MDIDYETARLLQEEFQHEFLSPSNKNLSDSFIARQLQDQYEKEITETDSNGGTMSDSLFAKSLQEQFQQEVAIERPVGDLVYDTKKKNRVDTKSLVDPSWEVIDPTPDIHVLFMAFNKKFFWDKLGSVCVSWSTKMKRCAGVCSYQGHGGMCHITLSEPLLKLRPRKDLIETLLHEMIHAFLFVTHNNRDRDGHGPEFHKHMFRINREAGTNITVYHDFHDEVELYLQHWWRCDGPCQKWKPYFGIVRRSMNRAPGPNDRWWGEHSRNCGGSFTKIKSPEKKVKESKKGSNLKKPENDIRKYLGSTDKPGTSKDALSIPGTSYIHTIKKSSANSGNVSSNVHTISKSSTGLSTAVTISSKTNNIHGFSNKTTHGKHNGTTKNDANTIVINKKPSTLTSDNKETTVTKTSTPNSSLVLLNTKNENNQNETPLDYALVRNHWINKFPISRNSRNSSERISSSSSNKRKSFENIALNSKIPKIKDESSQNSVDCETVPCPVCNASYAIDELNEHLDSCLNTSERNDKDCIICSKKIKEFEYEQHLNECLKNNFDDDVFILEPNCDDKNNASVILLEGDSFGVNKVKCTECENDVLLDSLDEHLKICRNRNECPECGKKIHINDFDVHLAECLIKKFEQIDKRFNCDNEDLLKNQNPIREDEMVDCLACGKNILKANLNSHLDECLNEVFIDEKSQKSLQENDDKMYNCPFCLKLYSEIEMCNHIEICLKIIDDDAETENNKSIFLDAID